LLITWLTQPIKEEVVDSHAVVEEVVKGVLMVIVASDAVEAVAEDVVKEIEEDVALTTKRKVEPGFPSPSLVVSSNKDLSSALRSFTSSLSPSRNIR